MVDEIKLQAKYILAKCCNPTPDDDIIGYFSFDDFIKVHRKDCNNLNKAEPERLVELVWKDIIKRTSFPPTTITIN